MSSIITRVRYGFREFPVSYVHLTGATLVVTYAVMLLGAYTSAIGAGLSCPDWPTCYGTWVPFLHPEIIANSSYSALQIFAEWAHRGLAMTAGFLILGTTIGAWLAFPNNRLVTWSGTGALLLLPIQVLLGGLTVTENLQPFIVTTHLGVATLILLCLLTTFLTGWLSGRERMRYGQVP
ncbi:COX15/CtaA family protein [Halomarina pelagica]|uniref:COX15/CtaA family protein n=1 Tax=Halomarina pelagica TaxID=2961599 RepID=UPI0020C51B1A|nr:COX15/CtaA family protein [Halomarina sp. BND7]